MEKIDTSLFHVYSYGIIADNKAISSRVVNVTPIEIASMVDGEIASNPSTLNSKGVDKDGIAYQTSVTTDNVIEATWLPFGSNRVTPPDVRRGEPVLIWVYDSVDKYYWTCLGLRDDLRRLETVVYAINGNPNPASKGFDPEDHYFIEMSTHSKQVTFRTSNKNGEPFKYTFQFNTKEGVVTLVDDTKNFFELDTKNITMKMELNTGTKVHLDKMVILAEAIDEIKLKVGGTETTLTPAHIKNSIGATTETWTAADTTLATPSFKGVQT